MPTSIASNQTTHRPEADCTLGDPSVFLDEWVRKNRSRLTSWRRHLHSYPELGHFEFETTKFLVKTLQEAGLAPVVLPSGTGVICDIGSGEQCVALRADIDALPVAEATGLPFASRIDGVAHACGHDAHTAILLGCALALSAMEHLPGRIRLIFQPAEEVQPGGALETIRSGFLEGVQRIFALHCDPRLPVGKVGTRVGAITSAADILEIRLTSPGGHTSRPHLTADLVHALGILISELPGLLTRRVDPRSGTVLVWGAVHAGEAPNTIPESGTLRGMLRTGDITTWAALDGLISDLVSALLAPTGVNFVLDHRRGVPPVINDAKSTMILREGVVRALGEHATAEAVQSSGGEDFGFYLEHVPGSFARLGVASARSKVSDLHQPTFDLDERALVVGVRFMVQTALLALRPG